MEFAVGLHLQRTAALVSHQQAKARCHISCSHSLACPPGVPDMHTICQSGPACLDTMFHDPVQSFIPHTTSDTGPYSLQKIPS